MQEEHYKFELKPLTYDYSALEPHIDTLTMQLHHNNHLKTYVDKLNLTLMDYPEYHNWSLEKLIKNSNWLPENIKLAVKNNAGGVYNHNFYFSNMTNLQTSLSEELNTKINDTFGNYDNFKIEFKKHALNVFGSGYAWLTLDTNNALKIITTVNQDTPLTLDMSPIITIDVWEHSYYLKHYNKRGDYIDDWFNVVNLNIASKLYSKCNN